MTWRCNSNQHLSKQGWLTMGWLGALEGVQNMRHKTWHFNHFIYLQQENLQSSPNFCEQILVVAFYFTASWGTSQVVSSSLLDLAWQYRGTCIPCHLIGLAGQIFTWYRGDTLQVSKRQRLTIQTLKYCKSLGCNLMSFEVCISNDTAVAN